MQGMSAELVGAVKQLSAVLRRSWSLSGQPPDSPRWYFLLPSTFVDGDEWKSARKFTYNNALFGCLSADTCEPALIEAMPFIPPLKEIGIAIDDIKRILASKPTTEANRFRYLFKQFCERQWASGPCENNHMTLDSGTSVKEESFVGYSFEIMEEQFIVDLLTAVEESLHETQDIGKSSLTERELNVLEAIDNTELSAEQIAERAGYPCNSAFRTLLSGMKKRNLLIAGRGGNGYRKSPNHG